MQVIAFIGFGLIGGSIAKGLKKADPDLRIMAYARNKSNLELAQEEGIVNVILDRPDAERLSECDMVFLAAPVEDNLRYLAPVAAKMREDAVLTDVGSVKTAICEEAKRLSISDRFIGGHPMAGSEQAGYKASTDYLFANAYYILCPVSEAERPIRMLRAVAEALSAIPLCLPPEKHDADVAAVSHLPHIVASSLVNLVRESDDAEESMKMLAAGGFRDITRIASSSPEMWEQICETNAGPLSAILDRYIAQLSRISDALKEPGGGQHVLRMFQSSRAYRDSINVRAQGLLTADYSFSIDIADEVGAISTISVILASKGISIKNIGINNARDHGEGALRISFYEEEAEEKAREVLARYRYDIR